MARGKPRWRNKLGGGPKLDICSCGYINCDSSHGFAKTPYIRKLHYRQENKLCIGCGHKVCTCKNLGRKSWRFR